MEALRGAYRGTGRRLNRLTMDDNEPGQLLRKAKQLLDARNPAAARELLERAAIERPRDINVHLLLAAACRNLRDFRAALTAADGAVKLDPYSFLAHLTRGSILEDMGERHAAAEAYRAALAQAPAQSTMPANLQASMGHAEQAVRQEAERLYRFLLESVSADRSRYADADMKRFDECVRIFAGVARPHVHEPSLLNFPRLAAIPFYEESLFPWLPRLGAATDMIRAELNRVIAEDWGNFHPYVQYPDGAPLRQWKELNHSPAWNVFDLWRDGKKVEANCRRCPGTVALLEELPLAVQAGYGPSAMFSVLAPRTRIPPHTGSTNVRLITHLPLILPPRCAFRVGNEVREWRLGSGWVFDDSIEHEAWNDSDETRVILIFDVWNPLVTDAERALVSAMMTARQQYR